MRILVLGAGGIGGYFGGRLAQGGGDVTFLVRRTRAERLAADGLTIESPLGDARLTPTLATQVDQTFDLILLSCKAYDLASAIEAIRDGVGEQTSILPLLNGLAHLDILDAAFGPARILGGLAHISVAMDDAGRIRHLNKLQTITYGPRSAVQTDRCAALQTLFATAPFETRRSGDIMQDMWEKFAFITAAAAITCLMRANVGAIMATDDGERFALRMLDECNGVAEKSGHAVRAKARDWAQAFLTQRGSDFTASMLRDIGTGRPIEAEHLQGDMIRRGETSGARLDLLKIALCHLQAYQNHGS